MSPLLEAARFGHTSVIRVLVLEGGVDVTLRDKDRNSALSYLVTSGKGTTPDFLLLCPAAQRKRLARERRLAEGRKSMIDLINESTVPRARSAWVADVRKQPDKETGSGKFEVVGACSASPFVQDYTGQLHSVVFQMAQRVQILVEKPTEEEIEDVQRMSSSKLHNRRHSSPLPDLQEYQEYMLSKYLANVSLEFERVESKSELSPRKSDGSRKKTLLPNAPKSEHKSRVNDGRWRLQPLAKDGLSQGNCKCESEKPLALRRRRSSLPSDAPLLTQKDQHDQEVIHKSAGRRRSTPSLGENVKSSPKKTVDHPSPSSKKPSQVRRLSDDSMEDQQESISPRLRNIARRSSLPLINANSNSLLTSSASSSSSISSSSSSGTSSSSRTRRVTHPSPKTMIAMRQKRAGSNEGSAVCRPRSLESRLSTSWEGKSSKSVPSYLFR